MLPVLEGFNICRYVDNFIQYWDTMWQLQWRRNVRFSTKSDMSYLLRTYDQDTDKRKFSW